MDSEEMIEEQYHKVYSNALVYGFEEALQIPYKKKGLDVQNVEDWPVDKINYVPNELKEKLVPALQAPWKKFHANLEKQSQVTNH
jgi:predicted secreted Zn-dependent protease